MKPGIYDGMPNADYHGQKDWLGSTSLKTLAMQTPAHYRWQADNPSPSKPEYIIGTAAHSLILEDDTSKIQKLDFDNYRKKAAQEARDEAIANGAQPLLAHEWAEVVAMRDAVMANPLARQAFTNHIAEQSFFWQEDDLGLKCRPDAQIPGLIADLKTTVTAAPNDFGRRAFDIGYFMSAVHYQDGVQMLTGERPEFVFVQVEKSAPYLVSVVQLDQDAAQWGRAMLDRAKRIYRECTAANNWPGYPQFSTVGLPKWAEYQLEELAENE